MCCRFPDAKASSVYKRVSERLFVLFSIVFGSEKTYNDYNMNCSVRTVPVEHINTPVHTAKEKCASFYGLLLTSRKGKEQ